MLRPALVSRLKSARESFGVRPRCASARPRSGAERIRKSNMARQTRVESTPAVGFGDMFQAYGRTRLCFNHDY